MASRPAYAETGSREEKPAAGVLGVRSGGGGPRPGRARSAAPGSISTEVRGGHLQAPPSVRYTPFVKTHVS
eukprot:1992480-Rhodomonas_salina.4